MIYKIAGFFIEIKNRYSYFRVKCKDYEYNGCEAADFKVEISDAEIEAEKATETGEPVSNGYYESLAIYRKICANVLQRNAFMMHGAVIEYEGNGYLFTAKSGTGKTTHIRLWQQLFGEENVTVVNGDKPILRVIDEKVYAYGTPWCGKEGYNTNTCVPLAGICFLEREKENSIKKISDAEALPRLFSQIMIHDSADLAKQLELVDALLERVPTYLLKCNMEIDAAKVSYDGMKTNE